MKNKIQLRLIRGHNYYLAARQGMRERAARLRDTDDAGIGNIPGEVVLAVLGVIAAGAIGVVIYAFIHNHIDNLPSDPTY